MSFPEFCAILSFIGTVFLSILGVLIASGTPFLEWDIKKEGRDKTKQSLFISAALYFLVFLGCIAYKANRDKRLAEEAALKGGRMRLISTEEDNKGGPQNPQVIQQVLRN